MFPLNLQRNIVQLDRQISLLEHECKNMEAEKKKKCLKADSCFGACSKISNARLKPPPVKVTLKKTDSTKKNIKPTTPISARLQSSSSLQSSCPKAWSEINDSSIKKKTRLCTLHSNSCGCKVQCSPESDSKKEHRCAKCVCCNEVSVPDIVEDEKFEENKRDYLLHKELVIPNTSDAIEVTVARKPNSGKENSPVNQNPFNRKSVNSENQIKKDLDDCKSQIKGQKWSEILCGDSLKRRDVFINDRNNKILTDETKIIHQTVNTPNNRKLIKKVCDCHHCNHLDESIETPVKLSSQSCPTKGQSKISSHKEEIVTQPCGENCCGEPGKELKDPAKIFKFLVNQFQQMSSVDSKKTLTVNEAVSSSAPEKDKNHLMFSECGSSDVAFLNSVKCHCENLLKEKAFLSEQLLAKDNTIAAMKKREEEYLSLINSLKSSLEKTKETAEKGADAVKELNMIKTEFVKQSKLTEALQKNLLRVQKIIKESTLENDKLRTEINIFKLETQKNEVLLAGKEAEIKRYKEEILNFKRQISDHLASLRLNAQEINVEKMVEAIVQQSQIFALSELDSVVEKEEKDSSKLQDILIHSSPTSTKTSVVNSSWKQISSIHEHDLSKAESDAVIYLNDDINKKDFFEIFGERSFSESPSKKSKEPSDEKLLDKNEVKRCSSFTSCLSIHDQHNSDKNSKRDSSESKESFNFNSADQSKKTTAISSEKPETNIDELLNNMKLKFSKEIFDNSLPSCTTDDFLDNSQISSISPLE